MIAIPVDSYPCSSSDLIVPDERFGALVFRTTWTDGQIPTWTLDILKENGEYVLMGLNVLPGADNIIKGQASLLDTLKMIVLIQADLDPRQQEIMGRELFPLILELSDRNPVARGDPLLENIVPLPVYWRGSIAKNTADSAAYDGGWPDASI
jgi:hypothetical protein